MPSKCDFVLHMGYVDEDKKLHYLLLRSTDTVEIYNGIPYTW